MARHFDGSDDQIVFAAGATALLARGAVTYLAFVRFASNHRGGLLDATDGGFRKMGCNPFDNGHLFFNVDGSVGWSSWDYSTFLNEYVIVGFSKDTGNAATVTGHLWQGGVWDHEDLGTIDAAAGSTIDQILMGNFSGDHLHGDLAVVALYPAKLGNAAIEAAGLDTSLGGWEGLSPAALWGFNQADPGDAVPDLTGGGADSSAITGTTITDDPVGFSFSTGVTATLDLTGPAATMAVAASPEATAVLAGTASAATLTASGTAQAEATLGATATAATLAAAATAAATAVLAGTAAAATLTMRDDGAAMVHRPSTGTVTRPDTGTVTVPRRTP